MESAGRPSVKINSTLLIIFSITLISVMGNASIAPAFPQFRDHFAVSDSEVAWLITVFTVPGIFLIPFSGWLADKYGRKTILIPSLVLFGIAGVACFYAPSFWMLLVFRFFQGIGSAPLNALNNTLIADFFKNEKRVAVMGYNGSVLAISTALYPAIGGGLAVIGWNFPFLLPLLAFPLIYFVQRHIREPKEEQTSSSTKNYLKTIRESTDRQLFILIGLVVMVFVLLYGVFITFFPFLMDTKFHYSSSGIGILMALMSVGSAVAAFVIGKTSDKINLRKALWFAFLLFGLGIFGIIWAESLCLLLFAVFVFGIASSVSQVSSLNLIAERAPKGLNGAYMAFNGMAILTGQTLGPALMGWIVGFYSLKTMFFVATGMSVFVFLLLLGWKNER